MAHHSRSAKSAETAVDSARRDCVHGGRTEGAPEDSAVTAVSQRTTVRETLTRQPEQEPWLSDGPRLSASRAAR